MAATQGPNSPFAQPEQQSESQKLPQEVVETVGTEGAPDSYKLKKSATGNAYVETNEYDPLEHHRSRDPKANKGEGLGFLCCCTKPRVSEPGMDRHYSMDPKSSKSMNSA